MTPFAEIRARAAARKGGEAVLVALLTPPKSPAEIAATPGDRFLAEMTRCVFQAGFNWKVIESKWDGFEAAFDRFDLNRAAMMSDEDIDRLLANRDIVRNGAKIRSVADNARYLLGLGNGDPAKVGAHFAGWRMTEYCSNLRALQKAASRLGGRSSQVFLRRCGVDSLVFSPDVLVALERDGIVGRMPSSTKDFAAVQDAINTWHAETGLSLNAISQILAFSVG